MYFGNRKKIFAVKNISNTVLYDAGLLEAVAFVRRVLNMHVHLQYSVLIEKHVNDLKRV